MLSCFVAFVYRLVTGSGRNARRKTYQDYPEWDLLPKATDFEDENIENARQR